MTVADAGHPGCFIALEGGEGAGKSTQEKLLAQALADLGHRVVRTREPGGTPAGEAIRTVVLSPQYAGLDERAEALLFAAARGEHVARVIRPALDRGDVVICDRYLDSSVAYQGHGRGLGAQRIRDLSLWATHDLLPDVAVLLDIDPVVGLSRVSDPDRLEAEPLAYHQHVRDAFLVIAADEPQRFLVLDATGPVDELAGVILERVLALLAAR
jgi:dTMP kinase